MINVYKYGNTAENNSWVFPGGVITADVEAGDLRLHDGVSPGGWKIEGSPVEIPLPGPQALQAGDTTAGFYGEVNASNLISGEELAALLGISAGESINNTVGWLKFASQGKTLYVAKKPIRYDITWGDIYRAGAAYRTEGTGVNPLPSAVEQGGNVTIDGIRFTVGLLKAFDEDPVSDEIIGGERAALLGGLVDGWGLYSESEITLGGSEYGNAVWTQEAPAGNPGDRYRIGDGTLTNIYTRSYDVDNSYSGWCPVLEVV